MRSHTGGKADCNTPGDRSCRLEIACDTDKKSPSHLNMLDAVDFTVVGSASQIIVFQCLPDIIQLVRFLDAQVA